MLRAFSIGPKMVDLIEQAGITTLHEMQVCDAGEILLRIHVETGTRLNRNGLYALENLVALANEDQAKRNGELREKN